MSVGNQYVYYDESVGWDYDGYFLLDSTSTPTTVTFSNNDFNFNATFPVTDNYHGTLTPPSFIVAFYTSAEGILSLVVRLSTTPSATTATTTTYAVVNYSMNNSATFTANDSFSMLFRYPEPVLTGPTGAAGPTGSAGTVGPTGPTGAAP